MFKGQFLGGRQARRFRADCRTAKSGETFAQIEFEKTVDGVFVERKSLGNRSNVVIFGEQFNGSQSFAKIFLLMRTKVLKLLNCVKGFLIQFVFDRLWH